jgi:hypothetical protein
MPKGIERERRRRRRRRRECVREGGGEATKQTHWNIICSFATL